MRLSTGVRQDELKHHNVHKQTIVVWYAHPEHEHEHNL